MFEYIIIPEYVVVYHHWEIMMYVNETSKYFFKSQTSHIFEI